LPEPSAIFAFIKAVLWNHWLPIVFFVGVPPIIVQIYKRITDRNLPHFRWIVIGGSLVAVFLAWNDEYKAKLKLKDKEAVFDSAQSLLALKENQIAKLRDSLNEEKDRNRNLRQEVTEVSKDKSALEQKLQSFTSAKAETLRKADIRQQLGKFLSEAADIKVRCLRVPRDQQGTVCESIEFSKSVKAFFAHRFDSSYVTRFENPKDPAPGSVYFGSQARSRFLKKLDGQIEFLRNVIKEQS